MKEQVQGIIEQLKAQYPAGLHHVEQAIGDLQDAIYNLEKIDYEIAYNDSKLRFQPDMDSIQERFKPVLSKVSQRASISAMELDDTVKATMLSAIPLTKEDEESLADYQSQISQLQSNIQAGASNGN